MKAIFVGRFQPFHKGHLRAVKEILKREKEILIFIGSQQEFFTKKNPFNFRERKEILKRVFLKEKLKGIKIFGVPDFLDDKLWAKKVLKIGKIEKRNAIVFTQNPWVKRCFEQIGVKVKEHPLFFGISATKIREKIAKKEKWEDLVPCPTRDYLKKINGEERIRELFILPQEKIINFIKERANLIGAKGGIIEVSENINWIVLAFLVKKIFKNILFLSIHFEKKPILNEKFLEKELKIKIKKIQFKNILKSLLKELPKPKNTLLDFLKRTLKIATFYYFGKLKNFLILRPEDKTDLKLEKFNNFESSKREILPLNFLYKTQVIEMVERLNFSSKIIKLYKEKIYEKKWGLNFFQIDTILKLSAQNFSKKEISFLTKISQKKIEKILCR